MTYRAAPVTQRDGSPLASSNCLMAAAATGLDYHTLGDKTSTGAKMREFSGDTSGGTNTDEIVRAWDRGYHEEAHDRDGHTFDKVLDDLWDGRLVMLQVWHRTVGGPCLSGDGTYGHGLAVAPEQRLDEDGHREWLVSDPWCKPPKWVWVDQSKLKAGAEEWATRCAREAVGGPGPYPDIRDIDKRVLRAAVERLFSRFNPNNPAPLKPPPEVGGGGGILFAATHAHTEEVADDVVISLAPNATTTRRIDVPDGTDYYRDALMKERLGQFEARTLVLFGNASGQGSRAVKWKTAAPYDDGQARDSIVYIDGDVGDTYDVPADEAASAGGPSKPARTRKAK